MRVRVFDRETRMFFKSEVFAIVNAGCYERYAVARPSEGGAHLMLVDLMDKEGSLLIYVVTPEIEEEWVTRSDASLSEVNALLAGMDIRFGLYRGYEWLLNDAAAMADLLQGKTVCVDMENHPVGSKLDGWNYIDTQADADALLSAAHGFHDSVLKAAEYVSGARVEKNTGEYYNHLRRLNLTFESEWNDPVELVFEGLIGFNLRPPGDHYGANIYGASIFVRDETVFFMDASVDSEDWETNNTCAKAYSLRWRFIKPEDGGTK